MEHSMDRMTEDYEGSRRERRPNEPTTAFKMIAILALLAGVVAYLIGLYNASMMLNEKGYYFITLVYGLYSAVSLQKTIRDREEGIPTTSVYYGISAISAIIAVAMLGIGLWNAKLLLSEKGFYAMAFVLSLFSAVTVQKNVRDSVM